MWHRLIVILCCRLWIRGRWLTEWWSLVCVTRELSLLLRRVLLSSRHRRLPVNWIETL